MSVSSCAVFSKCSQLWCCVQQLTVVCSQNAGQNCIGIERILVHESQHEELFNMLSDRADKLRPGHSLKSPGDGVAPVADVGAMVSGERFPGLQHAIQQAVEQGAILTVGGEPWTHPYLEKGSYFKPTLLGNVNPESPIAQSERECAFRISIVVHSQSSSLRTYWPDHQVRYSCTSD